MVSEPTNSARFEIYSVETQEPPIIITGRCVDGEVQVGILFSRLDPTGVPIALRVTSIEAYRHQLKAVQSGMSARLYLDGPACELNRWDVLAST